jgi:bleomycin hydrolase
MNYLIMRAKLIHIALLAACATITCTAAFSQSIGNKEMKELESSFKQDGSSTALQNILTTRSDFDALSENISKRQSMDEHVKYQVNIGSINDQKNSGRCWMFSCMNSLRAGVMNKLNVEDFDFSHNFNYFYDMLEKCNLFMEEMIENAYKPIDDREVVKYLSRPITDGGVWNIFYAEVTKYGVVPKDIMPETAVSDNDGQLLQILKKILRKGAWDVRSIAESGVKKDLAHKEMEEKKISVLKDVYRVLALSLGNPPKEFEWRYKDKAGSEKIFKGTPKEFYASIAPKDYNPDNYIMITNDPGKEYYKIYEVKNYKSIIEGFNWTYLNLPYSDIKSAALKSIKNGEGMYVTIDSDEDADKSTGAGVLETGLYDYSSLLGVNMEMDRKSMILTRQISSTHAILLMGCDTDANDVPTKWKFEDSFGLSRGRSGFLLMSDKWFETYTFRMVVNKKYLGEKAVKALGQNPILVPVWDYMMF